MSSDDWYRNKRWNKAVERTFYEKLGRARSQKYQYIVIQALSLIENDPQVSLRLVDEYFDTRIDQFEDTRALLARAGANVALGNIDRAVAAYQCLIKREEEFPNVQTGATIEYSYLVATNNLEEHYADAISILKESVDDMPWPVANFKLNASLAMMLDDVDYAKKALEFAKMKQSRFSYHRNLGLVGNEHGDVIKRLARIVT